MAGFFDLDEYFAKNKSNPYITGDYSAFLGSNQGPLGAKTKGQMNKINELFKASRDNGLTVMKLLKDMQGQYAQLGYDLAFSENGKGETTISIVPSGLDWRSAKSTSGLQKMIRENYAAQGINDAKMLAQMSEALSFDISIPTTTSGLKKLFGQDAVDQVMLTTVGKGAKQQAAAITRTVHQLSEVLNKTLSNTQYKSYLRGMANSRASVDDRFKDAARARASLQKTIKDAISGTATTASYQNMNAESRRLQQAQGTALAKLVKQGQLNFDQLLRNTIQGDTAAFQKARGAMGKKGTAASDQDVMAAIANEYSRILMMYAQNVAQTQIDSQIQAITEQSAVLKALSGTQSLNFIKNIGKDVIHSLGLSFGPSQENAFAMRSVSLVGNKDLSILGSLFSGGDRTALQMGNTLDITKKAAKARQMVNSVQRKFYTDLQSKNIADFKGNKLLRDMYRGAYASEAEIRAMGKAFRQSMNDKQWKQYVKTHGGSERAALASIALGDSGLHSETAFISESLRDALESTQYRTLSLSAADWSKYMGRVPVGTNRAQVKSEAMYRAIMGELGIGRAAVVGKNGGGPQVKIDPEGNALISFSTLKPVGVGNTKLMFGDLTAKATVAGLLSPEFLKFFAAQRGLQEAPQFILEKGGINARNMARIFSGHVAHMLETATPSEIKQLNEALKVNWFKEVGQVGKNGYYERAIDIFEKSDAATMAKFVDAWNSTFGGRSALSIKNGKLTYDANKPILSSIGQYGGYSYGQTVGNEPNVKIDYRALGSIMNTLDLLNHKGIKTNDMRKFLLGNVEFDNHLKRWVPVKGSKPGLLYGGAEGWKDSERALAIAKEVRENAEWNTSDAAKTFDLDSFLKGQMVVASRRSADEFFKSVIGDRQLSEAEQQALGQLIKTNFVNVSGTDPFWRAKYENGGVTNFADLLVGKLYNAQAAAGDQLLSTIIDLSDAEGNGPESRYFRIPNFKNFGLERNGSSFNLPDNANVASIFKVIENIADGYAGNPGLAFNDFNNKLLETVDTKGGSIYQNLNPRIGHSFYGQVSVANVDKFLDENTSSFERHRLGAQVGASYDAASAQLEGYGLEQLADLYRYVWDDLYTRKDVDDKIGKICQKAENMVNDFHKKKGTLASEEEKNRAKIKALKGSLLASVTPGTNAYAERERVAASNGLEKLHNLPIFEFRNPLSHGHDLYNTELYVDRELGVKGSTGKNNGNVNYALRPGLGLQIAFNADADGDLTGTIMFAPGGGVAKSFKESADLYDAWLMRNAALSARDIQSDQSGKDYTQDLKDLMLNPETQEAVGVLTRLNKGYTGTFSNIFQAVNEALHQTAGSGTGAAPFTPEDYLTLSFFESAVQDAISAKKVINRIKEGGNPLDAVQGAFTDQETLVKLLKETDYGDAASRERLFNHMTAMGILGTDDKSAFSSRISNLTYSQFYTMFADENGQLSEENAARLAGLFGMRPEELVRFGTDNRIISGDKVRITRAALEQAIQNTQERLVKGGFRGGIGGSIRSRFSIVPGLRIYNNQHAGWSSRYRNQHLGGPNTSGAGGNFYSISRLLATAFNEVYPDTSAVEKGILDLMAANPGYDYPEFYSTFGVTAADLAMSDEQFNEAKSGYLTPLGGKIADAAQQIIAQAQNDLERAFGDSDLKEKLQGAGWGLEDKIKNVYQAQKLYSTLAGAEGNDLARRMVLRYGSSMISPGHGYGNIEGSEGLAFLLGSEMISPEILSMLESAGGYEEYLQGFGEEGTDNAAILRGFLGSDTDIWKAQQLANGAILNNMLSKYGTIGATELPLQYFDNNNNPHSGRADSLVYTTDAEGRTGITVFDKKVSKKITPHHMLQILAYVRALEHAQEVIKKMGYKSYGEMANGNFASDSGLKKMFGQLYETDPEAAQTLFTQLLGASSISGGITRVNPTTGEFELATLPFSNNGRMSLTGSREEDDRLLAALASNSNIEAWSEADRGLLNKVRLRTVGTGIGATPMGVSEYQNYRQQRAEAYKEYLTHLGVSEDESLPQDIRDMHAQMAEAIDTSIIRSLEMRMAQLRALFENEENGLPPEARRRAIAQMEEANEKYAKKEAQDTANAAYDSKITGAKTAMSLREEGVRAYLNVLKAEKALADARNEAANAGKGQNAQLLAGNKVYMAEQNLAAAIGIRDKYATQHPGEAGVSERLANAMYSEGGSSGGGAARGHIAQHGLIGGGMSAIGGLFSRLIRSYGLYAIMGVLRKTFSSFINTAKALDQTMVNLRIVTNGTKEETQELISQYTNLGKNIGASTQEVAASALEWQRQGYEAGEIIDLVTSSIYLSKLGMIEASEATKDLTNYVTKFYRSAKQ